MVRWINNDNNASTLLNNEKLLIFFHSFHGVNTLDMYADDVDLCMKMELIR